MIRWARSRAGLARHVQTTMPRCRPSLLGAVPRCDEGFELRQCISLASTPTSTLRKRPRIARSWREATTEARTAHSVTDMSRFGEPGKRGNRLQRRKTPK